MKLVKSDDGLLDVVLSDSDVEFLLEVTSANHHKCQITLFKIFYHSSYWVKVLVLALVLVLVVELVLVLVDSIFLGSEMRK